MATYSFTNVITDNIDIANPKDPTSWLAGGNSRNNSFAGGSNFSPTSMPSYNNKASQGDVLGMLLAGSYTFLNPAFATLIEFNNLGYLNLLFDDDVRVTKAFTMSVAVVAIDPNGNTNIVGEGEYDIIGYSNVSDTDINRTGPNLSSIERISNNKWNMAKSIENIASGSKIGIAVSLLDLATNESFDSMSTAEIFQSGLLGTVQSMFSSAISNIIGAGIIGSFIVSAVISELFEIAMGLDNSFGIGGEITTSPMGVKMYGESEGFLGIGTGMENLETYFARSALGGLFYDAGDYLNTTTYTTKDKSKTLAETFNYTNMSTTRYFSEIGVYQETMTRTELFGSNPVTTDTYSVGQYSGWSISVTEAGATTISTPTGSSITYDKEGKVVSQNVSFVNYVTATELKESIEKESQVIKENVVEPTFWESVVASFTSPENVDRAGRSYAESVNSFLGTNVYTWNTYTNALQLSEFYDPEMRALERELIEAEKQFDSMSKDMFNSDGSFNSNYEGDGADNNTATDSSLSEGEVEDDAGGLFS